MSEREAAEELLEAVRDALKVSRKLMKSKKENVKVFGVDVFTKLAEIEISLMEALGEKAAREQRNPLARRVKLT